jgi:uncharacterized protein YxeA
MRRLSLLALVVAMCSCGEPTRYNYKIAVTYQDGSKATWTFNNNLDSRPWLSDGCLEVWNEKVCGVRHFTVLSKEEVPSE